MERSRGSAQARRAEPEAPSWRVPPGEVRRAAELTGVSRRGRTHARNEDRYLIADLERSMIVRSSGLGSDEWSRASEAVQGQLFIVADGVGGYEGGDLASSVAVDSMAVYALTLMPWVLSADHVERVQLERGLESAVRRSQQQIRRAAEHDDIDTRLGTTLTLGYVCWPHLHLVHAGDSRGYVSRGDDLYRLTRDHTVAQAVLDADPSLDRRTVEARWGHVLANVIGGSSDDLQLDMQRFELEVGDRLLMCTDGLTAYLEDAELRHRLLDERPVDALAQDMVETAFDRGGHDDITLVLARF